MAIPNFTAATNTDNKLVLTDTTDYQSTVVNNRYWLLTKSNGDVITLSHPIVDGDDKVVDLDRDYALVVRLAINYNISDGTSEFSKIKNILAAPFLSGILYDLRKKYMDDDLSKKETDRILNHIELIDSFSDAAISLISTDIVATQKALDRGNDEANRYKCNI